MDDEILQEFLAESWENLARLDTEIVSLEKEPRNKPLLASIFRTIHTIKGTCGFIGLTRLGGVAHAAENVLGQMRDDRLEASPEAISLVLKAVDAIKALLEGLEATSQEPDHDNQVLIRQLDLLASLGAPPQPAVEPALEADAPKVDAPIAQSEPAPAVAEPVSSPPAAALSPAATIAQQPPQPVVEAPVADPSAPREVHDTPDADDARAGDGSRKSVADLSIRVNVVVLDSLMNLVGELVLTRNQLLQLSRGDDESKYAAPITHLNRVTTDLQEGVMKTRMQPIGNAWSKLPRLVRDLSQLTGKQIELEMSGAETELDRTVLDAIKDPLTHMVRNSADHGIESADARRAAGKPEVGRIRLNAFHEGGHVIISIQDDGAGINTDRVLAKAIANGLVTESAAAKLSHSEILALTFCAGLSTAEKVSSVSGRGVGMDVVRTAIERIGGTVDLNSLRGHGTTVRIKIPLTLAIISALVVESGGESFAIPQLGVVELVRLSAEDRKKIEHIHQHEVFRLRDRLLPLVHLDEALGLEQSKAAGEHDDVNIVVVQVGDDQFGLIVSEVFDTEEIVVKPVGSLLKDINIYQGTTILGDGRVIMILDVAGIASQFGGVSAHSSERDRAASSESNDDGVLTSLLLFDAGDGVPMAVPLSLVARLEEFPQSKIERSGERQLVQYRGDLLPLEPVSGRLAEGQSPNPQPVIVFSEGRQSMGLMVNQILDILEERLVIRTQSQRTGIMGTAVINGRATDIIDTQHYVIRANPAWFEQGAAQTSRRVLIIDDSLFFRQLATTALETEGYRVRAVASAIEAVELLERGERFDAAVSELNLPMMSGMEFADWVHTHDSTIAGMALIALTSGKASLLEGEALAAGFHRFLAKFNAGQLINAIEDLCRNKRSGVVA